jgi:hypothetical protein
VAISDPPQEEEERKRRSNKYFIPLQIVFNDTMILAVAAALQAH